jgi:hypothetical protein
MDNGIGSDAAKLVKARSSGSADTQQCPDRSRSNHEFVVRTLAFIDTSAGRTCLSVPPIPLLFRQQGRDHLPLGLKAMKGEHTSRRYPDQYNIKRAAGSNRK